MAESLGGHSWRVRRLKSLDRDRQRPEPSRTQREASALDTEIREVEEELWALGVNPDEWHHAGDLAGLSLDEHIAAITKELGRC